MGKIIKRKNQLECRSTKKKDQDLQESSNGNEEEPILVNDTDVTESRTEKIKE